ncbi:MAG: penicillin-binding protein activator LpoB [Planctomycetes bacterium]|nr:penicillin-binding protein activator LpoB [Planctomycetota bacterium]
MRTLIALALAATLASGCWYRLKTHDPGADRPYDEHYGHTDMNRAVERFAGSLLAHPVIKDREDRPVLVTLGIRNRTSEHIDTTAFVDKLETALLKSGKIRLVNREARAGLEEEIAYQNSGRVTEEQRSRLGDQLGATYVITGTFHSIEKEEARQVRATRGELVYYQLVLELTDLASSSIEWKDEVEIVREGRRPIIGW